MLGYLLASLRREACRDLRVYNRGAMLVVRGKLGGALGLDMVVCRLFRHVVRATRVDKVGDSWAQGWKSLRRQPVRADVALTLVKLLLKLEQAAQVVALEGETRTGAGGRDLELVDDLLPELVVGDALKASSQDRSFEKLAEVEFFAANLRHFEVVDTQVLLELD